jgi:hypothetical protein
MTTCVRINEAFVGCTDCLVQQNITGFGVEGDIVLSPPLGQQVALEPFGHVLPQHVLPQLALPQLGFPIGP